MPIIQIIYKYLRKIDRDERNEIRQNRPQNIKTATGEQQDHQFRTVKADRPLTGSYIRACKETGAERSHSELSC